MARLSSGIGRSLFSGGSITELSVTDRLIESVDDFLHTLIDPVESVQNRSLRPVEIQRELMTAAARWMMALKL
jgi:hypothetical protein